MKEITRWLPGRTAAWLESRPGRWFARYQSTRLSPTLNTVRRRL